MPALLLDRFAHAARALCDALETSTYTETLAAGIAEVLSLAEQLPACEPTSGAPEPAEPPPWSPTALPFDLYWVVLDPLADTPGEVAAGSLHDDLTDLRADLRAGLDLYDLGFAEDAGHSWRHAYRTHWGAHAHGALWALSHHRRS
ncbi:MAG: DUF5063 domain-containing protein [Alphaproteobacteria bacterium]|nr:DUF5063 domain-containing protein [Alphaproteobacteria bacterium]